MKQDIKAFVPLLDGRSIPVKMQGKNSSALEKESDMTTETRKAEAAHYKEIIRGRLCELAEAKRLGLSLLDNRDAAYIAAARAAVRAGFYTHASPKAQATTSYRARMGSAYRWVVRQAGVLALILSSLLWIAHLL